MPYIALGAYVVITVCLIYTVYSLVRSLVQLFSKRFVPYVPTAYDVFPYLKQVLDLDEKSVFYDLGCGDGRIVRACHDICPTAACIGIEKQLGPYMLARLRNRGRLCKTFKIIRGDFFDYAYSDATHIVLYLFPEIMDLLLPKFQKELKPGTKVISIDFTFSGKKYSDVIRTSRSLYLTGQKIYVYEF